MDKVLSTINYENWKHSQTKYDILRINSLEAIDFLTYLTKCIFEIYFVNKIQKVLKAYLYAFFPQRYLQLFNTKEIATDFIQHRNFDASN